jgi:Na+-translocating ferredoxin:NAD+ oxidoreductase RnfD subunit
LVKTLIKVLAALVAVAALGLLFVRSVRSTSAEPFSIPRANLNGWTLALAPADDPLGALLTLRPDPALMPPLSRELFARMGESLHYPTAAMPVVLRAEFDRAIAGTMTPDALLDLARQAGLDAATIHPECMARRRDSAPGVVRGIYFLVFDVPQFAQFREQLAMRIGGGGANSVFDPAALSPVVVAANLDGDTARWLPLRATQSDCFAPIVIE